MDTSITPLTRLACEGRHRLIIDGQVTNVYSQRKNIPDEKIVLKGAIVQNYDKMPPEGSLYEVGDKGKTRFEQKYSAMWEWKAAKNKIPQPAAKHFDPGGKKVIKVSSYMFMSSLLFVCSQAYSRDSLLSIHLFYNSSCVHPDNIATAQAFWTPRVGRKKGFYRAQKQDG